MRQISTLAIPSNLVVSIAISGATTRMSMCSAAAVAQTTGMSSVSALRAAPVPEARASTLLEAQCIFRDVCCGTVAPRGGQYRVVRSSAWVNRGEVVGRKGRGGSSFYEYTAWCEIVPDGSASASIQEREPRSSLKK